MIAIKWLEIAVYHVPAGNSHFAFYNIVRWRSWVDLKVFKMSLHFSLSKYLVRCLSCGFNVGIFVPFLFLFCFLGFFFLDFCSFFHVISYLCNACNIFNS